jgi:cobalt-zinc-cadmium efflux system outer membrane protein
MNDANSSPNDGPFGPKAVGKTVPNGFHYGLTEVRIGMVWKSLLTRRLVRISDTMRPYTRSLPLVTTLTFTLATQVLQAASSSHTCEQDGSQISVSLSTAIDLAFHNNPSQRIALHTELSARQNYLSQSSPINPYIQYGGINNSVGVLNGFGTASNYAFYLTLETSGRWKYRSDQARWEYIAAKEGTQGARIALLQSVTAAYVSLQVAQADLYGEQLSWNDAKKLATLAEEQFKLGAASETNSIRANIALKQEDQNLFKAKSTLALAIQTLDNQMGLDPGKDVVATDPLASNLVSFDASALQKLAIQSRYELRQGLALEKSLQSAIGLNRANYFPDVLVGAGFEGTGVEVGLNIPIDLGSIRSSVNKAKEDLLVQKATDERQRQQVLLDVRSAYENLVQAEKVVTSFQSDELPEAQSLFDKVQKGYALGAGTILDVLDAQNTLRTARTGLNDAVGAYNTALSQLLIAIGLPLDKIKAQSPAPPNMTKPAPSPSITPTLQPGAKT